MNGYICTTLLCQFGVESNVSTQPTTKKRATGRYVYRKEILHYV